MSEINLAKSVWWLVAHIPMCPWFSYKSSFAIA